MAAGARRWGRRFLRVGLWTGPALLLLWIGWLVAYPALDRAYPPDLSRLESSSTLVVDRDGRVLRAFPASGGRGRFAAGGADFLGDLFGRTGGTFVLALQAAAQVVDQDLGALLRRNQRALTSNAVAAARDEDNLAV